MNFRPRRHTTVYRGLDFCLLRNNGCKYVYSYDVGYGLSVTRDFRGSLTGIAADRLLELLTSGSKV